MLGKRLTGTWSRCGRCHEPISMNDTTPLLTLTTDSARNLWLCQECAEGVVDSLFEPAAACHPW